ncbi:iron-sulfur cluster biosynthesis family protein [Homoserinimonas sp. OAct 916]|uniref:iron-sulfur cluster biosynthesis family protein n=1 Tax=Homoserinimonas sp. OAct 916 TaxID=2211450 RepID=UPI000DBE5EDC|nr:iron-sulfur cluster biosynthesis family protein [Homoserinimonas sp. OAct 916]
MLTLTEDAQNIVKAITGQSPGADDGGLRIASANPDNSDFSLAVAPAPEPEDQVVESSGARVFLEENAAMALSDKVLDAQVDEQGSVRFGLGNQE